MAGNAIDVIFRADTSSMEAAANKIEALSKRQTDAIQRAADKQVADNNRFIASIQRQVDTFGLSGTAMLAYEAKLRGVTAAADPLIARLNDLKTAQAAVNKMAGGAGGMTGSFQAAAQAVSASLGEIQKGAAIAQSALLGIGGALSLKMFAGVIEGAIESKAKLLALSTQTGISVEALSGLGKAAKFSGTDLSDVAASSNRLSKALFTQNEDSKGAAQALQALGLNFADFKGMAPEQQFVSVAHAMSQFSDGTAKSAAAMLLYGKSGATLLPFLKELEERGYAVGKQTTESAVQAKRYEDNLTSLKMSADAWKRTLAEAVLPTMIEVSTSFVELRKGADSFNIVGAALKTGFETVAVLGANVSFVMQGIGREIGAIAAQAASLAKGDFAAASAIHQLVIEDGKRARAELDETEKKYLGIKSRIGTAADFQRTDKDTTSVPGRTLALSAPETSGVNSAQQKLESSYTALMNSLGEEKVRLDANTESWKKYGRAIGDSKEAEIRFSIDQGKLTGKGGASLTEAQKNAAMLRARDVDSSKRDEDAAKLNTELDNRVKRLAAATNAQAMNSREVEIANDMAAAEKAGLVAGTAAWEAYRAKIVQTVNAEHDRTLAVQMRDSSSKVDEQVKKLQAETDAIGAGTLARMQMVEALRIEDEARKRLLESPGSKAQIETEAAVEKARMSSALASNYGASRTFESGSKTAFQKYQEDAGNAAAYAEKMIGGSFQHMEDALLQFEHTGKVSFSSLFAFMSDEFLRNINRMVISTASSGFMSGMSNGGGISGGFSGMFGALGGLFGSGSGLTIDAAGEGINAAGAGFSAAADTGLIAAIPLATGTNYVPYDGMQATLHKGEAVVPAAFNPAAGGKGSGHIFDFSGQTIHVGQGVNRGEVAAAVAQGNAQAELRIRRLMKQGALQ